MYRALHVGDLFWSLANKSNDQMGIGMVLCDGVGDGFEQYSFTGLWRSNDQATLSTSNRGNQVNQTARKIGWCGLQIIHLVWEDRGQSIKVWAMASKFGIKSIDGLDAQHA